MNITQFNISFQDSTTLLKDLNLFKNKGVKKDAEYSVESKKISKKNKHKEIYEVIIENLDYDILLVDDSVFQFSFGDDIRYSFIQNPIEFVSKKDYLSEFFSLDEIINIETDELESIMNLIDESDYEQYLNEQAINTKSNYIRYDVSESGYQPLIHSYSHVHFGMNEHLRIPCSKIITPLKFVMFCIKVTYYFNWKEAMETIQGFEEKISESKSLCEPLGDEFWKACEEFDLHLK